MKNKYVIYLFEERNFIGEDTLTNNVHAAMDFDTQDGAKGWMQKNRPMEDYTILMVCDDNF